MRQCACQIWWSLPNFKSVVLADMFPPAAPPMGRKNDSRSLDNYLVTPSHSVGGVGRATQSHRFDTDRRDTEPLRLVPVSMSTMTFDPCDVISDLLGQFKKSNVFDGHR